MQPLQKIPIDGMHGNHPSREESEEIISWGKIAKFFLAIFLQTESEKGHFCAYNIHIIRVLYHKVCTMSARCPHDRCSEGALLGGKNGVIFEWKNCQIFYLHFVKG